MIPVDTEVVFSTVSRGGSDGWKTPYWIIKRLLYIQNTTWLDPFPLRWHCNGFESRWTSNFVFVNPPYSRLKSAIDKGLEELTVSPKQLQIWLVPSRTETVAYQRLLNHVVFNSWPILFFRKRIQFISPTVSKVNAPFPSTLFCLAGEHTPLVYQHRFITAYGKFGRILQVIQ